MGQLLGFIGAALAVVLVSGLGVAGFTAGLLISTVSENAVEIEGQESIPPDIAALDGGFNILLTGVDACEEKYAHYFAERCSGKAASSTLNDVNMLIHVSDEPRRITAVSFPRDLMIAIPECTNSESGRTTAKSSKAQLNTAYGRGGLNCVVQTISALSGMDIQFAASVTFGGVIEITDAIGGVEVCLADSIRDIHTNLNLQAGTHELSGIRALQFLRTRHGLVGESDLARIGNQQVYLNALVRKLTAEETLSDVSTMLRLADTALRNLEPSVSLSNPMVIAQIALAVKDVPFSDIAFLQYPVTTDPSDSNRVVPIRSAAVDLFEALESNEAFTITHENSKYDGVIVEDDETEPTAEATPSGTPEPTQTAVELPSSVKGTTVDQKTCSSGNGKYR